jgi:hypothetical protein
VELNTPWINSSPSNIAASSIKNQPPNLTLFEWAVSISQAHMTNTTSIPIMRSLYMKGYSGLKVWGDRSPWWGEFRSFRKSITMCWRLSRMKMYPLLLYRRLFRGSMAIISRIY